LLQGGQQVRAQNNRFFTHSLPNLWQNTVTEPAAPIRIRTPNVSEKFLVSVIRNQSFREIVMTSYVSRLFFNLSARNNSVMLCNKSVNDPIYKFTLPTPGHTHTYTHTQDTASRSMHVLLPTLPTCIKIFWVGYTQLKIGFKQGFFTFFCATDPAESQTKPKKPS
jgi:hypothetical protein